MPTTCILYVSAYIYNAGIGFAYSEERLSPKSNSVLTQAMRRYGWSRYLFQISSFFPFLGYTSCCQHFTIYVCLRYSLCVLLLKTMDPPRAVVHVHLQRQGSCLKCLSILTLPLYVMWLNEFVFEKYHSRRQMYKDTCIRAHHNNPGDQLSKDRLCVSLEWLFIIA